MVTSNEENLFLEKGPAWRAAEAYGFDMSLIESNLHMTPMERIRAHDRVLNTILDLKRAEERFHGKS
ncbi:MAG: hypothetical protein AB1696_05965 [Planctomycetota bacterium]